MLAPKHTAMQYAMRERLLSVVVATTDNDAVLGATSSGYTRTDAGSFIDDHFAPGMEITPTGFPSSTKHVIVAVAAKAITVDGAVTASGASAERTLSVGLPTRRLWETISIEPAPSFPYVEEQYVPGPAFAPEIGPDARTEIRPMYAPRIFVPLVVSGVQVGYLGDGYYADAILAHFPRGLTLTCSDDTVLCVRSDVAPTRAQRSNVVVGYSCIPITIPFYTM